MDGWLKERGKQQTDSTHVFGAIRALIQWETIGETMRATLNTLATIAPEWLCGVVSAEWFDRYEKCFEGYCLPKCKAERQWYAEQVGADGFHLLEAVYSDTAPLWLRVVPMVQTSGCSSFTHQKTPFNGDQEDLAPSALLIHSL
jgi:transposase